MNRIKGDVENRYKLHEHAILKSNYYITLQINSFKNLNIKSTHTQKLHTLYVIKGLDTERFL